MSDTAELKQMPTSTLLELGLGADKLSAFAIEAMKSEANWEWQRLRPFLEKHGRTVAQVLAALREPKP